MIRIGDSQLHWQPGMTLAKVMEILEEGDLYAVVRLNGRLISRPDFAATAVPDESVIEPLPLIAGG